MQGVSEQLPRFEPKRAITRAEFAALLDRLAGDSQDVMSEINFKDVTEQDWYYQPIARAVEKGWIKGVSPERVQPERAITREEMAVMIARLLQSSQQETARAEPNDLARSV